MVSTSERGGVNALSRFNRTRRSAFGKEACGRNAKDITDLRGKYMRPTVPRTVDAELNRRGALRG